MSWDRWSTQKIVGEKLNELSGLLFANPSNNPVVVDETVEFMGRPAHLTALCLNFPKMWPQFSLSVSYNGVTAGISGSALRTQVAPTSLGSTPLDDGTDITPTGPISPEIALPLLLMDLVIKSIKSTPEFLSRQKTPGAENTDAPPA